MNDNFADTSFQCGEPAALVSYLYDECEPAERDAIAAHVAGCRACAEELDGLRATRRMLPAWAPPQSGLGFQITGDEASGHVAQVLRPARWWQRPLPAWGQAAAAAAIFAAGLAAGTARAPGLPAERGAGERVPPASVDAARAPQPMALTAAPAVAPLVSREDFDRLERDLRSELARVERSNAAARREMIRASTAPDPGAAPDEPVTMERVQALIQESERRQRGALIEGMAQVVSDVEHQRVRYLAPIQRTVEGLSREAATNRSSVNALANVVSIQSGFRPVSGR